ncbi:MAG TPA: hypothetical protein VII61_00530, partial [Ktedonobacteraceae bacterium]
FDCIAYAIYRPGATIQSIADAIQSGPYRVMRVYEFLKHHCVRSGIDVPVAGAAYNLHNNFCIHP